MGTTKVEYRFNEFQEAAAFARDRARESNAPIRVFRRFSQDCNPHNYHFAGAGSGSGLWCVRAQPGLSVKVVSSSVGSEEDVERVDNYDADNMDNYCTDDGGQGLRSDWSVNFDDADADDWEDFYDRQDE